MLPRRRLGLVWGLPMKYTAILSAALFAVASAVSAATLSVVPGTPDGSPTTLISSPPYGGLKANGVSVNPNVDPFAPLFEDDNGVKQVQPGASPITTFSNANAATGGLVLTGTGSVKVTFLGSEASFANQAGSEPEYAVGTLNNKTSVFGASYSFFVDQGNAASYVPLTFRTLGFNPARTAENGGAIDLPLLLSFGKVFNNGLSVIAYFEDKGGDDLDLDDMVVRIDVTPIPVPASVAFLLSAFTGLGFLARRRAAA